MRRLDISYRDEIVAGQQTKERDYWLKQLSSLPERTAIPYDHHRTGCGLTAVETVAIACPGTLAAHLVHMSNKSDSRLHMILCAALVMVLSRYTGSDDIIFGSPTVKQEVEGKFINTVLILRNRVHETDTFKMMLMRLKQTLAEAAGHVNYPLDTLLYKLGLSVEPDRFPLFDVGLLLENIHPKKYIGHIPLNLLFSFSRQGGVITGNLQYNPSFYTADTVRRLAVHFVHLLEQAAINVDMPLGEIDMLTEEETHQLLYEFNGAEQTVSPQMLLHELFEGQAVQTPDAAAVIWQGRAVGYRRLNDEAQQVARALRDKGVTPGTIVALMLEPSPFMLTAILAVLKTGGVYLPIDPVYPQERIQYMLEDSNARILLGMEECQKKIIVNSQLLIVNCKLLMGPPQAPFHHSSFILNGPPRRGLHHSDQLAYIIYTSGTTGRPKGVAVEHRNVVNMLAYRKEAYKMGPSDVALNLFSYSFDGFITSCFTPLISGAAVVLLSESDVKDIARITAGIVENKVTHMICVPPLFKVIIRHLTPEELSSLKVVTLAGDGIPAGLPEEAREKNGSMEIVNEYGVTEGAVMSTIYRHQEQDGRIKIGRPIRDTQLHILNPHGHLQPVGIPGELHIAGAGIARGYLNNPELTAERFNRSYKTYIFYKTGDLGRWLPDGPPAGGATKGVIEFLGRIDGKVKIRGFRVELGEIENRLLNHNAISEAVVLVKGDNSGEKYLCAYIVVNRKVEIAELKQYLSDRLPLFMVPAYFIILDKLPLTPNGKLDRNALPEPGEGMTGEAYTPPRDEVEKNLVEIWGDVLGVEKVGISDNFFMIGGDSIKAIQIAARLKKYRLDLKIDDLFLNPTVKELAEHVKATRRVAPQETVSGEIPLTPIQHWFFRARFNDPHHFNQSVMLYRADGFDEALVEKTFTAIINHHDALRMVYKIEGDAVTQWNRDSKGALFDLEVFRFENSTSIEEQVGNAAGRIQRSICLETGPLVKLGLFKTPGGDHLLIAIHHLVIDGVSWRILLEDFNAGYIRARKGEAVQLPLKTDSFKYWSEMLNRYAASMPVEKNREFRRQLEYWKQVETAAAAPLPRGRDVPPEKCKIKYVKTLSLELTEAETEVLLKKVNHAYNTEINDILLTALGMALEEWTGNPGTLIHLEGHGRESLVEGIDISRTIGWFTSQFPFLLDTGEKEQLPGPLIRVKEALRQVPDRGAGYGILKYLVPPRDKEAISFQREPEVCFNYLGQFLQERSGSGPRDGEALFEASTLKTGDPISPESNIIYSLDVRGLILGGRLKLSFVYNDRYTTEEIETLRDRFKWRLSTIIDHCTKKRGTQQTVSDFTAGDLDDEEMEDIFAELED